MRETIIRLLALFGAMMLISVILLVAMLLFMKLREIIDDKRYDYVIAHRFDKPPTANCYCKDCVYWLEKKHYCKRDNHFVNDCDFCSWAEPMTLDEYKQREEFKEEDEEE